MDERSVNDEMLDDWWLFVFLWSERVSGLWIFSIFGQFCEFLGSTSNFLLGFQPWLSIDTRKSNAQPKDHKSNGDYWAEDTIFHEGFQLWCSKINRIIECAVKKWQVQWKTLQMIGFAAKLWSKLQHSRGLAANPITCKGYPLDLSLFDCTFDYSVYFWTPELETSHKNCSLGSISSIRLVTYWLPIWYSCWFWIPKLETY
jgi:hypothetical protein